MVNFAQKTSNEHFLFLQFIDIPQFLIKVNVNDMQTSLLLHWVRKVLDAD